MSTKSKAPAFKLPDQDGQEHSLTDYKGSWVILYFYPKDNTPGCTIEAIDFTHLKTEFEKEGATILGCSPDSAKSHCNFIEKQKLRITLLCDPDHKVMEKYGAWGEKKNFGIKYMGVKRSTTLIDPDGKVVYHWKSVKAKEHAQKVLKKLRELKNK